MLFPEIWYEIFPMLHTNDIFNLSLVSKTIREHFISVLNKSNSLTIQWMVRNIANKLAGKVNHRKKLFNYRHGVKYVEKYLYIYLIKFELINFISASTITNQWEKDLNGFNEMLKNYPNQKRSLHDEDYDLDFGIQINSFYILRLCMRTNNRLENYIGCNSRYLSDIETQRLIRFAILREVDLNIRNMDGERILVNYLKRERKEMSWIDKLFQKFHPLAITNTSNRN